MGTKTTILSTEEMENILYDCVIGQTTPCYLDLSEVRDHNGRSLLHWTVNLGLKEETEYLLTYINPNVTDDEGQTPLHITSDPEIALILIRHGADPNLRDGKGRTPLHYARSAELAELLIHHGANPHIADNEGNTPLHTSDAIEVILRHGADPNLRNKKGLPPIFYTENCKDMMLLLHATDRDIVANTRNEHGETLLHLAARYNCVEAAQILVEFIDINSRDADGNTALHLACIYRNFEMIKWLLSAGADLKIPNKNGLIPFKMIVGMCRNDIPCAEILEMVLEMADVETVDIKMAFNTEQIKLLQLLLRRNLLQKILQT